MLKNRKINKILVVAIAIALFVTSFTVAFAGDTVASKLKEAKEAAKKAAAATENYEAAEKKMKELQSQIEVTQANIKKTGKKIKKKKKEIKKQEQDLGDRLTAMYKTGTVGYIDVILSSEGISDLVSNLGMVQQILENDQDMLKGLEKEHKKLKKLETKLEDQKVQLDADKEYTAELKKKYQKEADKWRAKEEQLNAEATALALATSGYSEAAREAIKAHGGTKGYVWPTTATYISSEYGWRICPFHGKEYHNGLDIAGAGGSPIYSTNSGIVVFAGWNGGYGNCVIVQMENYKALYGHMRSIACKKNQFVAAGQLIGYMGTTGSSTGNHLHFTTYIGEGPDTINPHVLIGYR